MAHILAVNSDQDFPSLPSFVRDAISWHAVRSGSRSEQQPALAAKSPTKSGEGRSIPPEQTAWAEGAGQRRPLEQPSAKAHGGGSVASALKACVQQSPLLPRKWTNVSDTILSGKYTFHDYESGRVYPSWILYSPLSTTLTNICSYRRILHNLHRQLLGIHGFGLPSERG